MKSIAFSSGGSSICERCRPNLSTRHRVEKPRTEPGEFLPRDFLVLVCHVHYEWCGRQSQERNGAGVHPRGNRVGFGVKSAAPGAIAAPPQSRLNWRCKPEVAARTGPSKDAVPLTTGPYSSQP
jgi:hypothetical protein